MNRILSVVLMVAITLATIPMSGCSSTNFVAALNAIVPAATAVIEVIAVYEGKPADPNAAQKIAQDVTAAEQFYADYQAALASLDAGQVASTKQKLEAGLQVLVSDIGLIEQVAQIKDPATQAKVSALVLLIQTGISIAEAVAGVQPVPVAAKLVRAGINPNSVKDVNSLVKAFNQVLVAKTGNSKVDAYTSKHQVHIHGKLARVASFGKLA
jgi:hypothetical protein